MYTFEFKYGKNKFYGVWSNGKIVADVDVRRIVQEYIRRSDGGITGNMHYKKTDLPKDGFFFAAFMEDTFTGFNVVNGDVPTPPELPEGAIG